MRLGSREVREGRKSVSKRILGSILSLAFIFYFDGLILPVVW
jgi:hypothetical protein